MEIKELKEKIQELIKKNDKDYKEVIKRRWDFLYKKLDEVKEIETLEHLKKQAGDKFLKAYLLYKSISRANYQPEHLNLTNFKNVDKYLEAIDKDVELVKQEFEEKELRQEKLKEIEEKTNMKKEGHLLSELVRVKMENYQIKPKQL
ncbi:1181_t:CDS:2 [Paraglomus brasilianum]|uniref:1181_t:CDS:1 n=1 Tax=Paraglomus brasilianum TaxID=144538 RepID=A0A9N9FMV5_9GLOM|nr:1181_t:CDS:2 [Paraglomus brasilianum]